MTKMKRRVECDAQYTSTDFRELFRYQKDGRTRAYQLRVVSESAAELWVMSEGKRQERKSRRLVTFADAADTAPFLESIAQELRAGGWAEIPAGETLPRYARP